MKVGFIGTGGTGKTTLIKSLQDTWDGHGFIKLPFEMRDILGSCDIETELDLLKLCDDELLDIQYTGLNRRLDSELNNESMWWYSDRTVLDHFLYIISWLGSAHINEDMWEYYDHKLFKSLSAYDLLFYFPKDVFHKPDGIRLDHYIYHQVFDILAQGFLLKWRIPHQRIESPHLQERQQQVIRAIEEKQDN